MNQQSDEADAISQDGVQDLRSRDDRGEEVSGLPTSSGAAVGETSDAVGTAAGRDMIMRIPVTVDVVIGHLRMPVAEIMKLGRGSVITLDRRIGEPVDLIVNGHLVARGEIVVIDESERTFGVTLTELAAVSSTPR